MKKQACFGLCATLLVVSAQPIFAVSAPAPSQDSCVFKNYWQPQSYKNSTLKWISNATQNGQYKVTQQKMGCNGNVCTLSHVLGKSSVKVCQGQSCYLYPGNNWDLNLARSYCSYAYQEKNDVFGHVSEGGPLW